jgi:large subunit ribosomal protein L23Ae
MKILLKPITTEKTVRMIELEGKVSFIVDFKATKPQIAEALKKMFNVKIEKINTQIKNNQKTAIIKLKEGQAVDVATKLGLL